MRWSENTDCSVQAEVVIKTAGFGIQALLFDPRGSHETTLYFSSKAGNVRWSDMSSPLPGGNNGAATAMANTGCTSSYNMAMSTSSNLFIAGANTCNALYFATVPWNQKGPVPNFQNANLFGTAADPIGATFDDAGALYMGSYAFDTVYVFEDISMSPTTSTSSPSTSPTTFGRQ